MVLLHILLIIVWIVLTKEFTIGNLVEGFVLVLGILYVVEPAIRSDRFATGKQAAASSHAQVNYATKLFRVGRFILYFLWELLIASWRILILVITPSLNIKPGIVGIPLDITTDAQITLLANLITLTPGTLSLDVSADRKTLYVHVIDIDDEDIENFRQQIKQGFERQIIEVFA